MEILTIISCLTIYVIVMAIKGQAIEKPVEHQESTRNGS
jgi:hypothetical protein